MASASSCTSPTAAGPLRCAIPGAYVPRNRLAGDRTRVRTPVRLFRMARIGALDWMHVFVDVPPDAASTSRAFWSRALGWETGPQWTQHPEFRSLIPDAGDRYVHVQEIDG